VLIPVGNPPTKRTQQKHVQLQERLQNLCRDLTTGQITIAEYLCGVGASPLTVASCTFQMAGENIGGLRVNTRRTA
jgi:hypothetical protein